MTAGLGEKKKSVPQKKRGAASLVAAGILLSRISGLVRDRFFAHYLGNSVAAGAFRAALRIPNFLQNLFGEGVLSASFIPVYSRLVGQGKKDEAKLVAETIGSILALGVSIIVVIGVLLTRGFVDLVAPGFTGQARELTVQLVRILFPGIGLLVLSAWCLGILNSHRRFFLSYFAPVFWNLAMIVALLIGGKRGGQENSVVLLAWGSVVGSILQLGVQIPTVLKLLGMPKWSLRFKSPPVREVLFNLGPVILSRGVVQLSAYVDGMIASFLGPSAVASLAYAQTIYFLPISLFGMSVAAAELPELSSAQGSLEERYTVLRTRLSAAQKNVAFFVIPSVCGIVILGKNMVSALYQTGQFGPEDTRYVWYILVGSAIGMIAATTGRLFSSAYYALGDTRTPLRFAVARVSLTAVLGVLFAFPLRTWISGLFVRGFGLPLPQIPGIELGMGSVGLTASAGIAGWIEFLLLKYYLEKKIGPVESSWKTLLKLWGAAITAAVIAHGVETRFLVPNENARSVIRIMGYSLDPILVLSIYGVIYLSFCFLMGEVRRRKPRLHA